MYPARDKMKYFILFLLMASSAGAACKDDLYGFDKLADESARRTDALLESQSRKAQSTRPNYEIHNATITIDGIYVAGPFVVTSTTEAVTLDEFVKSGKFCEIYGHKWDGDDDKIPFSVKLKNGCILDKCELCHRCRRKVKVNKQVEGWEP